MPALILVLGLAVAIAIAAGRSRKPAPQLPPAAAAPAHTVELDHGMPEELVRRVLDALVSESDPRHLETLADALQRRYPLSTLALRARADVLRAESAAAQPPPAHPEAHVENHAGGGHGQAGLPGHPAPATHPASPQPVTVAPQPSPKDMHASSVLQAAMRALVEETDPVVLDGFAESIREPYPIAASLLAQRAEAIRAAAHAAPMPPQAPAPAAPPANSPTGAAAPAAQPAPMENHS